MEEQKEAQKGPVWDAIHALRQDLALNTATTNAVKEDVAEIRRNTAGIVDAFEAGKGAFKVLGWLGTVAKWVGAIAGACAAVWGLYTAARYGLSPGEITPK